MVTEGKKNHSESYNWRLYHNMWHIQKQKVAQGASDVALLNCQVLNFAKLVFLNVAFRVPNL